MVVLPTGMVQDLSDAIAELRRDQEAKKLSSLTHLLLCESTGQPWRADHFRHRFAEIRAKAAATCADITPDHQAMHLRHTAVMEMADAGCTPTQISSVTGHRVTTVGQMLDKHYWAPTEAQATAAFRARLAKDAETKPAQSN